MEWNERGSFFRRRDVDVEIRGRKGGGGGGKGERKEAAKVVAGR